MFRISFITILLIALNLNAAYQYDNPKLGNIAITAGIWKTNLNGDINNATSNTNLKNDLGYKKSKNISYIALDLKNDISWIPNIKTSYFALDNSANSVLNGSKVIDSYPFNGSISTNTVHTEFNMIFYGFLYQGPFEFNLGLKAKKINFEQTIKENVIGGEKKTITGPGSVIVQPHIALKFDLSVINTVLMTQASFLSIGDSEAKDYSYSLNYRIMRNMYISYGYKSSSWKSHNTNDIHEKYEIKIKGNYLFAKIMF